MNQSAAKMGLSSSRRGRGQAHFSEAINSQAGASWPKHEPVPEPPERLPFLLPLAGRSRLLIARMLVVSLAVCCLAGCVQRRLTIRSNPPGAMVYVDNYPIGTTPVSTGFTYYGTRQIRLVKDGYETITVEQPIRPPWYQIFPLDFVTENMIPWDIRDERHVDFAMVPQQVTPIEPLLERGENLRQATHLGIVTPAAQSMPPVLVPGAAPEAIPAPAPLPPGYSGSAAPSPVVPAPGSYAPGFAPQSY